MLAVLSTTTPVLADCYGAQDRHHQTRFVVSGAEVEDTSTGLIWKRCSSGLEWTAQSGCTGQILYSSLDDALASAKDGWRVPSGPELESLVDVGCGSPVVDPSVFPDVRADEEGHAKYWTTNPVGMLELYWNFDFIDGHPDGNSRGVQLAVRLVRNKR